MTPEKDPHGALATEFEHSRAQLHAVAHRMLSSRSEAEDALQEAWLRANRADTTSVENLRGWLTTVVARVCLDMLRARRSRREAPEDDAAAEPNPDDSPFAGPERDSLLVDSVGIALLVVLETLSPSERLAFVLHDLFDLPFEEIAPIVGSSSVAARQLASRARRRVRGGSLSRPERSEPPRQHEVVQAFLSAARSGDLSGLLAVLDPEVVLRCDPEAVERSAAASANGAPFFPAELRGATQVASTFSGRAQAARVALIDGNVGAVWAPGGTPRAVFNFRLVGGKIVGLELLADPIRLQALSITLLDPAP
jgi:RNA polymerase sigma-70 factor (ECF subfamily)